MAFTVYNWFDPDAPQLNGLTGSLLSVLDAVLVTGYGTKPGAGWTKPLANTSSYGMFKLGNGTTASLFVYDAGSGSAGGCEALMTGWDSITSMDAGAVTGSNPFPTYAQVSNGGGSGGSAGALVVRKSLITSSVTRQWIAFADSASLYLYTRSQDVSFAMRWSGFFFGDFYSLRSGSIDSSRCMIMGRNVASNSAAANDWVDQVLTAGNTLTTPLFGHYAAHGFSGSGASIALSKHGNSFMSNNSAFLVGSLPFPNGTDTSIHLSPLWLVETPTGTIRGRLRGLWHILHPSASVHDYQTFSGSGDTAGKIFQIVAGSVNTSNYTMEISDTLETNSP